MGVARSKLLPGLDKDFLGSSNVSLAYWCALIVQTRNGYGCGVQGSMLEGTKF